MKTLILAQNELFRLCEILPKQGVILLRGDLASGKTSLVQEFLKFLDFKEQANSPTFSLMQRYDKEDFSVYHYDIYQKGLEGILQNGLFENFFEEGLHFVEWGDEDLEKVLLKYGIKPLCITISNYENKRKYEIYE